MAKWNKREPLVHQHLERVSRALLEQHKDIVRSFIGRNAGIYALYRKGKLYYVGLASGLSGRLKAHQRNKHGSAWDQFSIYLTIQNKHIKEIESLVLQIAKPPGNSVGGRAKGSKDMLSTLKKAIKTKQDKERNELFGKRKAKGLQSSESTATTLFHRLFPKGARLRAKYRGREYRARLRRDGKVRFDGVVFPTLAAAAKSAAKRPKNGWNFWTVQRGRGNWVRLKEIRDAGTPILSD